jgi:hypothetical protein
MAYDGKPRLKKTNFKNAIPNDDKSRLTDLQSSSESTSDSHRPLSS